HAEGQAQIKAQVEGVRKELDSLRKSGKISDEQFQSLTKATYQTGQAMERGMDRQAGKDALGGKQVGSASDRSTDTTIPQRQRRRLAQSPQPPLLQRSTSQHSAQSSEPLYRHPVLCRERLTASGATFTRCQLKSPLPSMN